MTYKFEWNDIRALLTLLNVFLILKFGLSIAWIGLIIACLGIAKDLTIDKKVNGFIIHVSNALLNLFFLLSF